MQSEHFRLAFHDGLDSLASPVLIAAESVWDSLSAVLEPPDGRIDLVLDDPADYTNGWADPFPGNRVVLLAAPPVSEPVMAEYDDWWRTVLSHELTHVFMLDRAGRWGRWSRTLFGRVPSSWPLFPVIGLPGWTIEGLPVLYESRFTGFGRLTGTHFEMMLRAATLEGRFDPIDRASNPCVLWPGGHRPYLYGSMFFEHLARTMEPAVGTRLTQTVAASLLPPVIAYDRIGRRTLGGSFRDAWNDWRDRSEVRCSAWKDSLQREGVTPTEQLLGGNLLAHPRVSPDGKSVAFYWDDGRTAPALFAYEPADGRVRRIRDWNSEGTIAWMPDGGLLTSRLEQTGPHETRSELARVDLRGHLSDRFTNERLRDPDVELHGRHVVTAQLRPGTTRLAVVDLERRKIVRAGPDRPDEQWARPRWSPDGTRIAAERASRGDHDIVLLDDSLRVTRTVTRDRALDLGPTFSPDGRWLLFSSDRDGVMNLYAADLLAAPDGADSLPPLRRITRLLTGAFWPDVSPDGRWIYVCTYHADGYALERIPFDPSRWTEAGRSRREGQPMPASAGAGDTSEVARSDDPPVPAAIDWPPASRPYRPWRSLLPRWWLPVWTSDVEAGDFYGVMTSGADPLDRHSYQLWSAWNPNDHRLSGSIGWSWAGLGQPVLGLRASRDWGGLSARYADDVRRRALEREDHLVLSASLRRTRWASSGAVTFAAEATRERRFPLESPGTRLRYPDDREAGGAMSLSYRRTRASDFSFSVEEGFRASLGLRRHWQVDPAPDRDLGYTEGTLSFQAYQPLPLPGFARHVLAWRSNFLVRDGRLADWSDVGGISQETLDLYLTELGGSRFLPVRGFPAGARSGTRAFSASLEHRVPLVRVERGPGLWPIYLHHLSARLFADCGDAWATRGQGGAPGRRTGTGWSCLDGRTLDPLVSGGAELAASTTLFFWLPVGLRAGAAWPLRGTADRDVQIYIALGG